MLGGLLKKQEARSKKDLAGLMCGRALADTLVYEDVRRARDALACVHF